MVSHIVYFISQLADGTFQTNDHIIGFSEKVQIFRSNLACKHNKKLVFHILYSPNPHGMVYKKNEYNMV